SRDTIYVRIALEIGDERVNEETVFLTSPRFLNLPEAKTRATVRLEGPGRATITFKSNAFQHRFAFDLTGMECWSSDNFFELYPNEEKRVTVRFSGRKTAAQLKQRLTWLSLVDTY
ncbi:MAG TPA: glycoside hydrolase family 2 protein, partial [Opitutus sp.]|nr:glycoside hydrolase family 2 protein [Opitutus sp.]